MIEHADTTPRRRGRKPRPDAAAIAEIEALVADGVARSRWAAEHLAARAKFPLERPDSNARRLRRKAQRNSE